MSPSTISCQSRTASLFNYKFIVEQAKNSKLKSGNTFQCGLFILGEPLYLTDLVQGNSAPVAFAVGNKDGLCELEKRGLFTPQGLV